MSPERREAIRYSAWLNLFMGIYNLYIYNQSDWWFNFVIGTLNIGVWVFFRKIQRGTEMANVINIIK